MPDKEAPDWLAHVRQNLQLRGFRPERESEIADEIAQQLDEAYQESLRAGCSEMEARSSAERHVADWAALRQQLAGSQREKQGRAAIALEHAQEHDLIRRGKFSAITEIRQDLLVAFRVLRKNPGFALVVIAILAIGMGANILIFSLAYAVLLRPLPYPAQDSLLTLWESNLAQNSPHGQVSAANYYDWESGSSVFSAMSAYSSWRFNLTQVPEPENLNGVLVTPKFFSVLGANPAQGRTFRHDEDQPGKDTVAVVSQSLWNRIFGQSVTLSGQTLTLNRDIYTVVGIMPSKFDFPSSKTDVWVPLDLSQENKQNRDGRWLTVIARVKPGVAPKQVVSDLGLVSGRLSKAYPKSDGPVSITAIPLHEYLVGDTRTTFVVLLLAVGLLLLLACANIASLLFAKGAGRAGEFAIRLAMGAGRSRIVRQLMTECCLFVAAGAAMGLFLAAGGVEWIRAQRIEGIPRLHDAAIDARIVAFAIGISLVVTVVTGLLPALRASSYNALKEGSNRLASNPSIQRRRAVLVVAQLSLAFVLLVGAGLLVNSFLHLTRVNTGIQVSNRLTFQMTLSRAKYTTNEQQSAFFSQALDRISRQSGIVAAGGISDLPLVGNRMSFKVLVEKSPVVSAQSPLQAGIRWTTRAYFDAIGMTLRRGRGFAEQDNVGSLPVAVVNQSMADRVWPGQDPIGMRVRIEEDPRWFTVVGVVGDIKQESLDADEGPTVYFTYAQKSEVWLNWMSVVIHTASDPHGAASLARQKILSLDKDQPIANIATLEQDLANLRMIPKLRTMIMSLFSFMAFSLAVVGIFGMVSFSVAQRLHEIGIRMALGAQRGDILRQFLVQGGVCVSIGVLLGIGGSLIVTRIMKTLLFEVEPVDLKTFGLVAILLTFVGVVACWLPAGRATRMDVIKALKYE